MSFLACTLVLSFPAPAASQPQNVCIQCHGSLGGRLGEPVQQWQGSIHEQNGVTCNECHGGDPKDAVNAMSPARGFIGVPEEKDIPEICGRCHIGVKRDYLASAHGKALGKGGPSCVTCHGNHAIIRASLALINERSCSRCHSYERAGELKDAMVKTETLITTMEVKIDTIRKGGTDTEPLEKALFSARNQFHTLFHDVNVKKVQNESARINRDLEKIDASLEAILKRLHERRIAGAIAVGAALLAALVLYLLRKTYENN